METRISPVMLFIEHRNVFLQGVIVSIKSIPIGVLFFFQLVLLAGLIYAGSCSRQAQEETKH